jgi:DNA-binding MarR family transcriptional regulator
MASEIQFFEVVGPEAGERPAQLPPAFVAKIRRGATRLARRMRLERPVESLSPTKLAVLAHVSRWGAATPGEIASAERLQPQSLTRVIAELEAEGLITRERDEHDRRQYLLDLTQAGLDALAADMRARDAWLDEALLAELTETERQVLYLAGTLMDRLSGLGWSPHKERRGAGEGGPERPHAGLDEQDDDEPE